MNPMLQEALTSILRKLFMAGAVYLVTSDVWTESQAAEYVAAAALAAVSFGWSYYKQWIDRQKLTTALASSKPMTENQVEKLVSDPNIGTPPASVPKDVIPRMLSSDAG